MLLSLVYRLLSCLFGLLAVLARSDLSKDVELLALRHENQVLCTVIPASIPRWHRDQIARKWTYTDRRGQDDPGARLLGFASAACQVGDHRWVSSRSSTCLCAACSDG